jgi:antitoxin PrlF
LALRAQLLSPFNIQHSTFNIQHSTFNIQHSTFNIQNLFSLASR